NIAARKPTGTTLPIPTRSRKDAGWAQYLEGSLARRPRFYNSLTANCTMQVFDMVRAIHPGLPFDLRVVLSGYLPNYAYDLGAPETTMPFPELRDRSRIGKRASLADADPDFSTKIREGIPSPSR